MLDPIKLLCSDTCLPKFIAVFAASLASCIVVQAGHKVRETRMVMKAFDARFIAPPMFFVVA
ncbi:hypothetical protein GCM10007933_24050 [Zoogloea oryzae]|uniref:Uncharacterized protein n=1 Tax=Zoogloea oryzae TaxID=310767 RepID=A0ABQ6FCD1_9RHOO|nr:hypothetical protein GCM10007933_24050 [Zoogloea oryzae]